jgi:hypothetical protein
MAGRIGRVGCALSLAGVLLAPSMAIAATAGELCESAKLKAAGTFARCRGKADSTYAVKGDAVKRQAAYDKCEASLAKAYAKAENKHGAECPTVGDVTDVRDYLSQCTNDVGAATQPGGGVPDYVVELAACNTSLATAQSGTSTAADVLAGKTFSAGAGLGATGTMPNVGAVTITPGATSQAISAGYHDGSGTVAGDADLVAGNIVSGVSVFGVTGTATTGTTITNGLLRTGQTTSWGAGSDGAVQAGTASSFTDNGNGTVTDNRTGLIWEKKSDDGGIHDQDTVYTWGSAQTGLMDGTMVTTFLAALNTAPCFAGSCDWRIPNRAELLSITNLETFAPAVSSAFNSNCGAVYGFGNFPSNPGCTVTSCSCTKTFNEADAWKSFYWSSSSNNSNASTAWGVYFVTGDVGIATKSSSGLYVGGYVRAVRGGL